MDKRGFTLVEVLVALTILAVGFMGIASLTGTALRTSGFGQSISQGVNIAQQRIEALATVDYDNVHLTDSTTSRTDLLRTCSQTVATASRPVYSCTPTNAYIDVSGRRFTWSYTVTFLDLDGSGTADASTDGIKRIDVTVSWMDALWRTTKSTTITTLRARG